MPRKKDPSESDLLRTAEVTALPLDPSNHETVPIDVGGTRPPPHIAHKADPQALTLRVPSSPSEEGPVAEDPTLSRATEKALSVPAHINPDRATLTVLTGLNAGQIVALDAAESIIGRGTEAELWLEDPAISREHARIVRAADGRYFIHDMDSTNGTFVSGRRVTGSSELQNGDRVQIGPTQMLRFAITDDAEEELQRRLYESSTRDALTRAFNRKYLNERLPAEIAHARRHRTELGLLMLDLDRFKEVNDAHGHLAGDMLLRVVAAHLSRLIRLEDVLARYGGEEFVILVRSTSHKDAGILAERVRSTVALLQIKPPDASTTLTVTVSVGVASLSELSAEAGPTELLATADARLYRAKVGGRNRVCTDD
jgi:diguanylate cyclase (GGDEF)-like protein